MDLTVQTAKSTLEIYVLRVVAAVVSTDAADPDTFQTSKMRSAN